MQKAKVSKRKDASQSGLARVALYRESLDPSFEFGMLNNIESFYDFSKPLRMLSAPSLIDGKYDEGFFFLSDRFKNL